MFDVAFPIQVAILLIYSMEIDDTVNVNPFNSGQSDDRYVGVECNLPTTAVAVEQVKNPFPRDTRRQFQFFD